jgi:hypothetical protein
MINNGDLEKDAINDYGDKRFNISLFDEIPYK